MLDYARWKYILVSLVLFFALLFALPNFFGDDHALQIARKDREPVTTEQLAQVEKVLKDAGVTLQAHCHRGRQRPVALRRATRSSCARATSPRTRIRADEGLRLLDDVCLARAALDAGPAPARHAAGPRPAWRPLSAVRSGRRRRGRTAAGQLRAGFPARAARGQDPVQRHQRAVRRFGREQWRARVAARGRRPRRGARRAQEGAVRPRVPRRQRRSPAPRSIAC